MSILCQGKYLEELTKTELIRYVLEGMSTDLHLDEIIDCLDHFSKNVENLEMDAFLLAEIKEFCSKDSLKQKIVSELGNHEPFSIKKNEFQNAEMEGYAPLGSLLHITSANSEGLSFLALVEGLISQNMNIVKLSRRDDDLCFKLVEQLLKHDRSEKLQKRILLLKNQTLDLSDLIDVVDGVSCWGGDSALESIKAKVPNNKRFIPWGHKISFALIDNNSANAETSRKLVDEILLNNQQACSAPQVCYLLDASYEQLMDFAQLLSDSFSTHEDCNELDLDIQQRAELTNYNELLRLESLFLEKNLITSKKGEWRIYIEKNSDFKASPLNRTIWIKSITSNNIVETFQKHRGYLQTVGLSISDDNFDVINYILKAGVTRVRELGRMQESYGGEPHDGEYALRRFVKRVSLDLDILKRNYRLDEKSEGRQIINKSLPVMTKEDFQSLSLDDERNKLFFRSGGSSGKSALSTFSYHSYHTQMSAASEGLYAAGLDPKNDRCMNLFFGGGLYGGFLSFFTILEKMKALQFPMAAYEDLEFVAESIVEYQVDTLLGMPSYIVELFTKKGSILKKGCVKKIFFGGEHFPEKMKTLLIKDYGVEIIRSASYGSVDAGPLGFQCEYCEGSIHHLNESIQSLEVLSLESDKEVPDGEVGRLVFTSKARETLSIDRYDLGDLGRIVKDKCRCMRKGLRFELLGRSGDIFRSGGTFFNFLKFEKILKDSFEYSDQFQIILTNESTKDTINLYLNGIKIEEVDFASKYKDLSEAFCHELTTDFKVIKSVSSDFISSKSSGKILRVVDQRQY